MGTNRAEVQEAKVPTLHWMNDFIYALDDGYDFDQPAQMIVTSTTFMSTAFNYIGSLSHESMALVAESLFQNITLGLLSSDTYTTNASTTPSIPVSVVHAHNIYFYSPHDLFLAYGLAIVAKLIAVTLASIAIWRQGLSYSTDFSSILRATRDLRLHRVLGSGEDANWSSSGADPTSKEIQEMLLVYQSRTGEKWAGFAPFVDTAAGSGPGMMVKRKPVGTGTALA